MDASVYKRSALLREYRFSADSGDPWASALCLWFDIAGYLWSMGVAIPCSWEYSPGAGGGGADEESYYYEDIKAATEEELLWAGNVTERYTRILKAAGHSY